MIFACIFVPDFPVAAIVRSAPELDLQPLAVLDGSPPLIKIISTNRAARNLGAQIGMTKLQAESVPQLHIRRRSLDLESAAHAALLDCACAFSPRVEDTKISRREGLWRDTVVLDIAGLEQLFGAPQKLACDMAHRAYQLGLPARVAIAGNPEAAIHAARGFSGVTVISPGEERLRLGPLPIEVLEPSAELLETFDRWGIRTFADLAQLPAIAVSERIGPAGIHLQTLARGDDHRPIVPADEPLYFEEALELEFPVDSLEPLAFIFSRLLDQICARLTARTLSTNELRLTLELEVSQREEKQFHHRTLKLPVPLIDAKIFLKLLHLDLSAHPPQKPVVKVALVAEPVQPRRSQGGLFVRRGPEPERLQLTLARVTAVVGEGNAGSPELLDTHRADAFRLKEFLFDPERVPDKGSPILCAYEDAQRIETDIAKGGNSKLRTPTILRRFRPPLAATVTLHDSLPVHISFAGSSSKIIFYAGPWRTSGEWWTTHSWSRDEWDIAASPNGVPHPIAQAIGWDFETTRPAGSSLHIYRIFRDLTSNRWFVEGSYD